MAFDNTRGVALITGSNRGIRFQTAKQLANVAQVAFDVSKTRQAVRHAEKRPFVGTVWTRRKRISVRGLTCGGRFHPYAQTGGAARAALAAPFREFLFFRVRRTCEIRDIVYRERSRR